MRFWVPLRGRIVQIFSNLLKADSNNPIKNTPTEYNLLFCSTLLLKESSYGATFKSPSKLYLFDLFLFVGFLAGGDRESTYLSQMRNYNIVQSAFLSQFLGFLEFPHEEPHACGEGYHSAEAVRKGGRQYFSNVWWHGLSSLEDMRNFVRQS